VIEDSADTREATEALLCERGVDAVAVAGGAEGLTCLRDDLGYCLILLDWRMPEMDGEQFRRLQLRDAQIADVPVVVVTGDPVTGSCVRTLGIGTVLRKPVDWCELSAAITSHCRAARP